MRTYPRKTSTPRNKVFEGSFDVDAAGAVSNLVGYNFAAAYAASAGEWDITLTQPGATLICAKPDFEHATGAGAVPQLGPYNPATGVLRLRLWDIAGAALGNVAGTYHFKVVTSDSMI